MPMTKTEKTAAVEQIKEMLDSSPVVYLTNYSGLTVAQANELTAAEIGHNVHAHPTLSEILHEAAKAAFGEAIHA